MIITLAIGVLGAAAASAAQRSSSDREDRLEERLAGPPKGSHCLVVVHLSSIDAFHSVDKHGSRALGEVLASTIDRWTYGPVLVLDQGWDEPTAPRRLVMEAIARRQSTELPIDLWKHDEDEDHEAWEWLEAELPVWLKKHGVTKVDIGGVWYCRDDSSGCVNAVYETLEPWTVRNGGFLEYLQIDGDLVGEDPSCSGDLDDNEEDESGEFETVTGDQSIPPGFIPYGSERWFEYHCWESPESADADLWYRSHRRVTVLEPTKDSMGINRDCALSKRERADEGSPLYFRVRFDDGHIAVAGEDELVADRSGFTRPDPPRSLSEPSGDRWPSVGDVVRSSDYDGQPWLYHATAQSNLESILEHGLIPGHGTGLGSSVKDHASDRVFFSTQPDKWIDPEDDHVLLRVDTDSVRCIYDGGEWLYGGDEDDIIDGRIADCYATTTVLPDLIEIVKDPSGGHRMENPPEGAAKRALLMRAARILHEQDPEHFTGGCGDNVVVLAEVARQLGLSGVKAMSGTARAHDPNDPDWESIQDLDPSWPGWHAWLLVDRKILDPTWGVLGLEGAGYDENHGVMEMLIGVAEDPEALRDGALGVVRGLKSEPKTEESGPDPYLSTWYHVTQASHLESIMRDGLRSGHGICGDGVYLFDSYSFTENSVDLFDEDEDPVILEVTASFEDSDRIIGCNNEDVESEGDQDYYDHVFRFESDKGAMWKPDSVRVVWRSENDSDLTESTNTDPVGESRAPGAVLYHGTSSHQLDRMKAGGWTTPLLYLSSNKDEAVGYANKKVEDDEMDDGIDPEDNDSVMITFDQRTLERTGELGPDWDDMQSAFRLGEIDRPPDQVSWSESLAFGGTCSYAGPVEEAIISIERWD